MTIDIKGTFEVATRETGVNGDAKFTRSLEVTHDDIPAFDEARAWEELIDVAILVHAARDEEHDDTDHVDHILADLTVFGDKFMTSAMRSALDIHDLRSGALAVRMDDPIDLWIAMDRHCRDIMLAKPALTFQPDEGVNFIRGAGNMFDTLAPRAIQMALDNAFAVKWDGDLGMVARPQEAMQRALLEPSEAPDLLLQAVHPWIDADAIEADARQFTIYDEGCPPHPSYVAGHGAFAGAVYALLCLKYGLHENKRVHEEVGQTLLSFAHCRSVAGVHYFQDNAIGFQVGVLAVKRGMEKICKSMGMEGLHVGDVAAACEHLNAEWAA